MAFYRGEEGTVFFEKNGGDVVEIAAVRSWSMTLDKESLDVTAHGATYRANNGSLISGSGTMEVLYDAPSPGEKRDLIREVNVDTDPANALVELYLTEASTKKIECSILVTSTEYSATVGDIDIITINFVTNGAITLTV